MEVAIKFLFGFEITELCDCGGKVVRLSDNEYGDDIDRQCLFLRACPVCDARFYEWYGYVAKGFYKR